MHTHGNESTQAWGTFSASFSSLLGFTTIMVLQEGGQADYTFLNNFTHTDTHTDTDATAI